MVRQMLGKEGSRKYLDLNNSTKRDRTFDLLKLYAMLSVVLDHSLQHMIGGNIQSTQLYNWIFLSQMPIFMFASGFFALNGIDKSYTFSGYCQRLGKTIASLLIPFISFSIIVSIIGIKNQILLSFLYPDYSLWFLWVLMWMQIIMISAQQIAKAASKTHVIKVILSLIFYAVGLIPVGIMYLRYPDLFDSKLIIFYSAFYMSGYIYAVIEKRYCLLRKDKFKMICIPIAAIIVAIVMIEHPTIIYDSETVKNIAVRCIGSISAVILMLYLSSYAVRCKWVEKISAFGVLSLEMYYVHLIILRLSFFNSTDVSAPIFILKYILVVVASLTIIILLKRFWITDLLLFGKLPNKGRTSHSCT